VRASASRAAPDDHLSSTAKSPEGSGQTSVDTLLGCAASAAHASVRSPLPRNQARPRTYQRPAPEFFTAINSFCGSRHNRRHNTCITLIFKVILRQNIPCAMVLTLLRALVTVACRLIINRLGASQGAPGPHVLICGLRRTPPNYKPSMNQAVIVYPVHGCSARVVKN